MEHRVLHKDGTIRWFLTRGAIASRDSGKTTCIVGTSVDISERKRTEEYLHQLTARLFKLQDEERRRIARELHDQTSQNLAAIAVNHARLLQNKSIQEPKVRRIIEDCQMLGEQALKEIRTLSFLLHPPLLDEAGLVSALRWYINGFAKRSGLVVDLIMSGKPERLPSDVEIALFRIVQESLTNIHRHSGSNTASITLQRKDDAVILEIKDQGRGLSSEQVLSANDEIGELGVGIPGMRQRMRQLGGNLEVNSSALGTTIRASVPLNTPSKVDHYSAQA
jgi:signal transduction histidine kinase